MGRIQLYISDEMERYLQETFGNNKSRIVDALIFDLSRGNPLSPEGIARALNRRTYKTSGNEQKSEKKENIPFKRKNSVAEQKEGTSQSSTSTLPDTGTSKISVSTEKQEQPITYTTQEENYGDSLLDFQNDRKSNVSTELLAKGMNVFGF